MIIDPLSKHTFIPILQHTISYLKKRGVEYADIRLEESVSEGVVSLRVVYGDGSNYLRMAYIRCLH